LPLSYAGTGRGAEASNVGRRGRRRAKDSTRYGPPASCDTQHMSLISVDGLAARAGDPALRIVDVRWYLGRPGDGRRAYNAGHIPGAIFADLDTDLRAPEGPGRHPLPDPTVFAARLGSMGIGSDDEVVVYDDVGGGIAARLWWMLDDLGHPAVSVLDGGLPAWIAKGLPIEVDEPRWPA